MEPSEKYLPALAEILGNDVYDILGYERPNPHLNKINQLWERLSPEHQQQLAEDAQRYEIENENNPKASRKRKPAHN